MRIPKTFLKFLIEEKMTPELARKILGVSANVRAEELKKRWRELALANHPDRGGETTKIADINAAHDVLEKLVNSTTGTRYSYSQEDAAADREKNEAFKQVSLDSFFQHFKMDVFVAHFERLFKEPFTATVKDERHKPSGAWDHGTNVVVEFMNASRSIVIWWSTYINYSQMIGARTLANADTMISMSIMIEILVNRRKVKLAKTDWRMDRDARVLSNPETLFPASKFEKAITKDQARKYSKRDVVTAFQHELNASYEDRDGGKAWIPVGVFKILLYRMPPMRKDWAASWGNNGLYKVSRVGLFSTHLFMPEEERMMNQLFTGLRDIQRKYKDTGVEAEKRILADASALFAQLQAEVKRRAELDRESSEKL